MRRTTIFLEPDRLVALFDAWDLWNKIRDGRLSVVEAREKRADAKSHPGADSQILKHYTSINVHVCTTHRIVDPGGTVQHWDEADVKVSGLTLAKRPANVLPA